MYIFSWQVLWMMKASMNQGEYLHKESNWVLWFVTEISAFPLWVYQFLTSSYWWVQLIHCYQQTTWLLLIHLELASLKTAPKYLSVCLFPQMIRRYRNNTISSEHNFLICSMFPLLILLSNLNKNTNNLKWQNI